jgi:hypothetical protein
LGVIPAALGKLKTGQNLKSRFGPKPDLSPEQLGFPYRRAIAFWRTLKTLLFVKTGFSASGSGSGLDPGISGRVTVLGLIPGRPPDLNFWSFSCFDANREFSKSSVLAVWLG